MKVSIGIKLKSGPWGGGNQAMRALTEYLLSRGVEVSHDLSAPDLDVILLVDPRRSVSVSAYTDVEIFRYLRRVNPRALVVHRVNECDERKGTKGLNRRLRRACLCADHCVFVSEWLRELHLAQGMPCTAHSVIRNGSDTKIFNSQGYQRWDGVSPLRLVTHHWGAHWLKGFDVYQRLDRLMASERFRGRISFTYIGNLPQGFSFVNARYLPPAHGAELASLLKKHHVYITASVNEPGSNHQNEGALCGLPILYRESGCLPEYCHDFGVGFTESNLEERIEEMMRTYAQWTEKMRDFPHTAERMCEEYHHLFLDLVGRREEVLKRRRGLRRVMWMMRALV